MKTPTEAELKKEFQQIIQLHKKHLVLEGIKLPKWESAQSYWLSILHYYDPEWVHKDKISDIVRMIKNDLGSDQQVRHLKRGGWNLLSEDGKHKIDNWHRSHPEFSRELVKSQKLLTAKNFEDIKNAYGSKCATCGDIEGDPSTRYPDKNVQLQKGHQDPEKPMIKENIIPQCQFCNRAYKDDFTFDDKGRVRAIASVRPVQRASSKVKEKILKYLTSDKDHE